VPHARRARSISESSRISPSWRSDTRRRVGDVCSGQL
jgi:hypothetical protein